MTTLATPAAQRSVVSPENLKLFKDEGYCMLPRVLSPEQIELLRSQADFAIQRADKEMDAKGVDKLGICHRGQRYFVHQVFQQQPELRKFLFSDLMADVTRQLLGPDTWLFWEQYVIKGGDKGAGITKFSWHQDSGYVHWKNKPYLTCWITLDDVTEENGTVYLLPYSRSGIRTWVKHIPDPVSNDLVGYFGSDRGIPVILPAGSIACFTSYVFHSSGPNLTQNMRRIYLAQYAAELVMKEDGVTPWGIDEPFLKNGQRV